MMASLKIRYRLTVFVHVVSLLCFLLNRETTAQITYNVIESGAISDGVTDAAESFHRAWESACNNSEESSVIFVPEGVYLISYLEMRGPCGNEIQFQINGTLVAPDDYSRVGDSGYWILFIQVDRVSVVGGVVDGRGAGFWACKLSGQSNCTAGARSLTFNWVNNAAISGLTSINSQKTHIVINSCNNVSVSDVINLAPQNSPNTDGIHVQSSVNVTITDSIFQTGDDCISIGPGTRNLWMERIECGPGHGVSIGSLGRDAVEEGVQNVTLTDSIFIGSQNGLRIKTWARPSKGYVQDVSYRNIFMIDIQNPIIIDQNYCPNKLSCPTQNSGIKISNVTYENIQGTSATRVAMVFDCSPISPCSGIELRDIKLTYMNTTTKAQSSCTNIQGTSFGVILPDDCLQSSLD